MITRNLIFVLLVSIFILPFNLAYSQNNNDNNNQNSISIKKIVDGTKGAMSSFLKNIYEYEFYISNKDKEKTNDDIPRELTKKKQTVEFKSQNEENEKENIITIILQIIFGLITFIILAFITLGFYAVIIGAILVSINIIFQFILNLPLYFSNLFLKLDEEQLNKTIYKLYITKIITLTFNLILIIYLLIYLNGLYFFVSLNFFFFDWFVYDTGFSEKIDIFFENYNLKTNF